MSGGHRLEKHTSSSPQATSRLGAAANSVAGADAKQLLGSNELIQLAAFARGLKTTRFRRGLLVVEDRKLNRHCFWLSESESNSAAGEIATHKGLARNLLSENGIPIPPGCFISAADRAQALGEASRIGYPLVVKPAQGQKGRAITTDIRSDAELKEAIERGFASPYGRNGVILERCIPGSDYRFFASKDKVISVVRREPASVVGDGVSTLAALVEEANAVRSANPYLARYPLRIESKLVGELLRKQGVDTGTVLKYGQRVRVSSVANLSQGGTSYEVRDSTHRTLRKLAVEAVRAIPGLAYGGVDLILEDHRKPIDSQDAAVIEVNARPASVLHHFPASGPSRDVAGWLIGRLVDDRYSAWFRRLAAQPSQARLRVTGRVGGSSFARWLSDRAGALSLDIQFVTHGGKGTRELTLKGASLLDIGRFMRPFFVGSESSRIQEVTLEPIDQRNLLDMVRRRSWSRGTLNRSKRLERP